MLRGLTGEQQRLTTTWRASRRFLVEVEIPFDLAAFFSKEMRQQKPRSKAAAEPRQQASSRRRSERRRGLTVLREESRPDLDVTILDCRKPPVDVLLLRVRLDISQCAIQERRIGFVLPMVLEGVKVRRRRGCHDEKYADSRKWVEPATSFKGSEPLNPSVQGL